jgi:type VI secretion system protein ImpJ
MSHHSKPIWTEGLFIKPVHFQQQERYLEYILRQSVAGTHAYSWGFIEVTIDRDLLDLGKLGLISAQGLFPDGTPFRLPEDGALPSPLDLSEGIIDQVVYLCLPLQSFSREVQRSGDEKGIFRVRSTPIMINDTSGDSSQPDPVHVGQLQTSLMLQNDKRSDYSCLPVAYAVECTKEKKVMLNTRFIPPLLSCTQNTNVRQYQALVSQLLDHRSQYLSARATASGTGGPAEVSDFLMLQTLNRRVPLFRHLGKCHHVHPVELYKEFIQLAGELATFFDPPRAPELPAYDHDNMAEAFEAVIACLREQLSTIVDPRAVSIQMMEPKYGIHRAMVNDPVLMEKCNFVLAVKANVQLEELRRQIPVQTRVSTVEAIRELIVQQLPGIPIRALPFAPRQIRHHEGFVYFELDRNNPAWDSLKAKGVIAIHIAANYAGLQIELWAVKGQ